MFRKDILQKEVMWGKLISEHENESHAWSCHCYLNTSKLRVGRAYFDNVEGIACEKMWT